MPFSGNGDGLTPETAYEILTPTHVDEIEPGFYYKFLDDVDYQMGTLSRLSTYQGTDINLNSYRLFNVGNFEFGEWLKDWEGKLYGGEVNLNVSRGSGGVQIFSLDESAGNIGTIENVRFTGTLESTTDYAQITRIISSNTIFRNCVIDCDVISAGTGNASIFGGSNARPIVENILVTGQLTANGTGVAQIYDSWAADATGRSKNVYVDVTVNPSLTPNAPSVGAVYMEYTTPELESLTTYKDKRYVSGFLSNGTASTTSGSATVTGTGTTFTNRSQGDEVRIGYGSTAQVLIIDTIQSDTEFTATTTASETLTDATFWLFLSPFFDMVDRASYVSETWSIQDGLAYPVLAWEVNPNVYVSGTVTLSGVTVPNCLVDIARAKNPFTDDKEIVDKVIADPNGIWIATVIRNTEYFYWGEPRAFIPEFTGNLSGGVSGSVLTTSNDLSGTSMGGANDDLWMFVATAGTGAGLEVAIKSRSGNDIDVGISGLFDTTTQYEIGKAYFAGDVFPKDVVV